MVDADAATRISDVERLEMKLEVNHLGEGIAIGSRHLLQADAVATRSCFRNILMYVSIFTVHALCRASRIRSAGSSCSPERSSKLFPVQHIERWAFDVELLHLAARLSIPVTEVAVEWTEMPDQGNLVESIPQMAEHPDHPSLPHHRHLVGG